MNFKAAALASLALAFLPGAAVADTQPTGILAAPFRMVPDQPVHVVLQTPTAQLPAGAKLLGKTVLLTSEQQDRQPWLSKLAVAGGAAPAFTTCILSVTLPDGRSVAATPGECMGTLYPAGPLQLDTDLTTVTAGNKVGVALSPQAAARLPR